MENTHNFKKIDWPSSIQMEGISKKKLLNLFNQLLSMLSLEKAEYNKLYSQLHSLESDREMREQFVAALTHDLITPLTSAKLGAEVILRHPENTEYNQQVALKIIKSINRMDQMIKDLLDVNLINQGIGIELNMNYCILNDIVSSALGDIATNYPYRFLLEIPKEKITGFCNEESLRRLLENLINNAIKYGDNSKIITVRLNHSEELVQIIVHNWGNPILLEDMDDIYRPFVRKINGTSKDKKGWGVGLALVKGVVQAHGGNIKVESTSLEGTSFVVTLPRDSRPFQILH